MSSKYKNVQGGTSVIKPTPSEAELKKEEKEVSLKSVSEVVAESVKVSAGRVEDPETRRQRLEESLKRRYRARSDAPSPGPGGPGGGPGGPGRGPGRGRGPAGPGSKPKELKKTIMYILGYLKNEKPRLVAAAVCVVISTSSSLVASYMLRPIINTYIVPPDGRSDVRGLFYALMLMLGIYLAGVAATYLQSRLLVKIGQNTLREMRTDLFDHMQTLPVKFYDTNTRGDLMSRFTNDIDNVGNMLSSSLISIFTAVITLVGTFCLMLYTNAILTLVTVVMIPLIMMAVKKISMNSAKYFSRQQAALGALNGYIEETVTGQKVIKVFNHEAMAAEEFDILNEKLNKNQIRAQFFSGIIGPVMNCSSQVTYTLTAVVGGLLAVLKGFDIGGLTVFLNYSRHFSRPINEIASTANSIFSALAGAERVMKVLEEKPEPVDPADACSAKSIRGDVVMEHVSFGYNENRLILKDINLYAHPGQKIAFVGSTGAGKTTVMNLLPRFYDIQEGSITIDGVDIKQYKRDELRNSVTMVLQESHLFSGTIMENIRYGRLDATDEEVMDAARTASADSFIRHLPNGYNTVIDADGSNLSQGQRQLLNIARAAVSKAPILILDEATSSVDTRTERLIDDGMHNLMADRTTFVIAHRLSTVRDANAIMVLEHGEIIERGTHEQLLELKGRYYELYTGKAELD